MNDKMTTGHKPREFSSSYIKENKYEDTDWIFIQLVMDYNHVDYHIGYSEMKYVIHRLHLPLHL